MLSVWRPHLPTYLPNSTFDFQPEFVFADDSNAKINKLDCEISTWTPWTCLNCLLQNTYHSTGALTPDIFFFFTTREQNNIFFFNKLCILAVSYTLVYCHLIKLQWLTIYHFNILFCETWFCQTNFRTKLICYSFPSSFLFFFIFNSWFVFTRFNSFK